MIWCCKDDIQTVLILSFTIKHYRSLNMCVYIYYILYIIYINNDLLYCSICTTTNKMNVAIRYKRLLWLNCGYFDQFCS